MSSDVSKTYWLKLKAEYISSVVIFYASMINLFFFGIQIDDCE